MSGEKRVQIALGDGTQITIPYETISELIEKLERFKGIEREIPREPTEEGNLEYIRNEKVRQLCSECLEQLREMGIELRSIKHYWFSGWYGKKCFMYLGCKQQFFVCQVLRIDGTWSGRARISSKADWDKMLNDEILSAYKSRGQ